MASSSSMIPGPLGPRGHRIDPRPLDRLCPQSATEVSALASSLRPRDPRCRPERARRSASRLMQKCLPTRPRTGCTVREVRGREASLSFPESFEFQPLTRAEPFLLDDSPRRKETSDRSLLEFSWPHPTPTLRPAPCARVHAPPSASSTPPNSSSLRRAMREQACETSRGRQDCAFPACTTTSLPRPRSTPLSLSAAFVRFLTCSPPRTPGRAPSASF